MAQPGVKETKGAQTPLAKLLKKLNPNLHSGQNLANIWRRTIFGHHLISGGTQSVKLPTPQQNPGLRTCIAKQASGVPG